MSDPIANFNFVEGVNLDDSKFSSEQIIEMQEICRQYLEDRYQTLDLSPVSGLHDSVIRPSSQVALVARAFIEEYNKSRTLHDALNNEGNEDIVDAILSNFLMSRRAGSKAIGTVRVNVENYDINQTISASEYITSQSGYRFFPVSNYFATSNPTNTSDITIFQSSTGNSGYFMFDIVAEFVGEKYNIQKDSQLEYSGSIDGLISIVALSQFSGGENNETNQSVYNRIISSLSARNMTSPLAIDQSLKDNFPDVLSTASHGVSSKYMKRNAHNIFGVKSGCFCDVYVKNASAPQKKTVRLIASKIQEGDALAGSNNEFVGKFLATISKNDFPGHYDVLSVKPISSNKTIGSYEVLKKTRKITDMQPANEIYTASEAAFSRYSSTDIIFSESPSSGLDEIAVMCEVLGLEDIDKIQDFVNSGGSQTALIDTLVKACVPCFVSLDPITVRISTDSSITEDDIIAEVASYMLGVDYSSSKIRSDVIVSTISSLSGVKGVDLPIRINAAILAPTEQMETISLSTISSLEIPSIPDKFIGPDTIGIFVNSGSIKINLIRG